MHSGRLNRVSSERRDLEDPLYRKAKAEYLEELSFRQGRPDPRCECGSVCKFMGKVRDIHHKKGRAGELLWNKEFFLGVCRDDHNKIGDNPQWAEENGFSIKR